MDQLRENYDAVLASPLKRMESALASEGNAWSRASSAQVFNCFCSVQTYASQATLLFDSSER